MQNIKIFPFFPLKGSFLPCRVLFWALLSILFIGNPQTASASSGCVQALNRALTFKNSAGALDSFGRQNCPLARDLVTWHFMKEGAYGGDFKAYRDFVTRHPDWPWIFRIRRVAEKRLSEASPEEVRAWFENSFPATLEGSLALIKTSEALAPLAPLEDSPLRDSPPSRGPKGQTKTLNLIREVWERVSLSAKEEAQFLALYGKSLREEDHFRRARLRLDQGDETGAARMLPLLSHRSHHVVVEAQIALAQKLAQARSLYNKAKGLRPKDYALQLAYLKWLRRTQNNYAAKYFLRHPEMVRFAPQQAWKEAHILLRRALEKGDWGQAADLSKAAPDLIQGGTFADAHWLRAWLTLKHDKDPAAAKKIFEAGYDRVTTPISRSRFAYWSGVCAEQVDSPAAKVWYARAAAHPGTFYGQQGLEKLGSRQVPAPPALKAKKALVVLAKKTPLFQAAALLLKAEHPRDAQSFLHMLMKSAQNAAEEEAVLKAVMDLSPPHLLGIAKEANPIRDLYYKELYPLLSKRHHKAYQAVDPALFHAVVRKESLFDGGLVSGAGALGLSQLLPTTAKEVAKNLGLPYDKKRLLKDWVYNTQIGSAYLASIMNTLGGSVVLGLVAYNAGLKYAYEWQNLFGDPRRPDVPLLDWIESLPFGETRNYVQRVLESRAVYRCILQNKCAAPPAVAHLMLIQLEDAGILRQKMVLSSSLKNRA